MTMAGNSQRRGAVRTGNKKGPQVGSGGQRRRGLEGKGPTPKAADRPNHKAHKAAERRGGGQAGRTSTRKNKASSEMVAGRNSVLEALRADVPVTTMYVAGRIDSDDRVREALKIATERTMAPRLRGSVMPSSATTSGIPGSSGSMRSLGCAYS